MFPGRGDNVSGLEPEVLRDDFHRRRQSNSVQAKDGAAEAGIAFPTERGCLFDRNARRKVRRQHAVAIDGH